jgi:hypothetical protein
MVIFDQWPYITIYGVVGTSMQRCLGLRIGGLLFQEAMRSG